jgi:hypothetical protein
VYLSSSGVAASATDSHWDQTNGRLGIGTTSPSNKLHISAGDSSASLFGPNSTWGAYLYVGSGTTAIASGKAQCISTNGNLHLDAGNGQSIYLQGYNSGFANAGGGTFSYGGWTHTGILQITSQPAFSAYRDAGQVPANTVFVCNNIQVNTGSHYNGSTGRFTAPVAGTYLFAFHCMAIYSPTYYVNVAIRKNGTIISMGHGSPSSHDHTNVQCITTMAVSDYVDAFVPPGYTPVYADSGVYNNFNGHLIG